MFGGPAKDIVYNRNKWLCRCDCGAEKWIYAYVLKSSAAKSCGCLNRESTAKAHTIHGGYGTSEYKTWKSMKRRCLDEKSNSYKNYGGRGIAICDRWKHSFKNFLSDMGKRPEGTSLDRIDNLGNYEPSNCRWATAIEQANNKRNNVTFVLNGITDTLANHCRRAQKPYKAMKNRIFSAGMSPEDAFSKPYTS